MRGPEHFEQRHIPDDDELVPTHAHACNIDIQIYIIYTSHRIYDISNLRI